VISYFHRKSFLGSVEGPTLPHSALFVCPHCGEAWGRVTDGTSKWQCYLRGCTPSHARDTLDMPESILFSFQIGTTYPAPRNVLLQELQIAESGSGVVWPVRLWYNSSTPSQESAMSPDLHNRIAELRLKAVQNTLSDEELKEALVALRADRRFLAAKAGAEKRVAKAIAAPVDTDALLKTFL
jgi:hypothetical protein